ncbi:MAG: sensor domain-containing protein, partial [Dehalococcoidia bacterium]
MNASKQRGFFGVVADPQSYINIFYLFLAFPLGIGYFVFLVTGISVGFGLLIIWVGVPILVLVLAGSWVLC